MKPKFNTSDPDMIGSFAALKRAARNARRLSIETGTPFIVVKDGKIVDLNATGSRAKRPRRKRPRRRRG